MSDEDRAKMKVWVDNWKRVGPILEALREKEGCTAEDQIVSKALADRDRDWADIKGIITAQESLDWGYIVEHLTPLAELKEALEILQKLRKLQ